MALAVVASIAIGTIIHADTHYVSHTGSNSSPYTSWATATDSLRAAIEAADEYDTVLVAAGAYTSDSLLLKKGQVFVGAGMDSTYVRHNGSFFGFLALADSSTTRGFHFDGIVDTNLSGQLNYRLGSGVGAYTDVNALFTNNRLTNVRCAFILLFNSINIPTYRVHIDSCEIAHFREAIDARGTSTKVTNNTFHIQDSDIGSTFSQVALDAEIRGNRFIKTVEFSGSAIIDLSPIDSIIIKNNLFVSDSISEGAAIWINRAEPGRIAEGEILNNTLIGGDIGLVIGPADVQVSNNVFAHILRYEISPNASGDPRVTFNTFWQTNVNGTPLDTADFESRSNMFVDPMFGDSLDFHLQAFSPAIDAGDPTILDADGSRSDIGYTGGPGGITYVYQDLPPKVPVGFAGPLLLGDTTIEFTWRPNHEADLDHYELNADIGPCWDSSACGIITIPKTDTSFFYTHSVLAAEFLAYFSISAVDQQGNRSAFSDSVFYANASVGDELVPQEFTLYPNYPNPFNASTQITYTLPEPSAVTLTIYDVMGRHLITLVSATQSAGAYRTTWNGTDDHGHAVGSGVYFYRLTVGDEVTTRKMLLLK